MSFLNRVLIYQSIITYGIYVMFFTNTEIVSTHFKDDIMSFINDFSVLRPGLSIVQDNSDIIFKAIIICELIFALAALLNFKIFGLLEAFLVLFHGFIKFNPFNEANKFQFMYGIKYEFLLIIGVFFAILVDVTSVSSENKIDRDDTESTDTKNENDIKRSQSPKPKKKLE